MVDYKDFWTRYSRRVTRVGARGLGMVEEAVSHRPLQALRLPDGQLPIVLATLETFPVPHSVQALRPLAMKMFETRKTTVDSSEVYQTQHDSKEETDELEPETEEEFEYIGWNGTVYLTRREKNSEPKNYPGSDESARRGPIQNSTGAPNIKRQLVCIRRGSEDRFGNDCPHPWASELNPKFATNQTNRAQFANHPNEAPTLFTGEMANKEIPHVGKLGASWRREAESDPARLPNPVQETAPEELYKMWENYYSKTDVEMTQVCAAFLNQNAQNAIVQGRDIRKPTPLILLGSGESRSVAGKKWVDWRFQSESYRLGESGREFRFGSGASQSSLVAVLIHILCPNLKRKRAE